MILFKKGNTVRNWLQARQKMGLKVGFVPTMGALHNGHISLINASQKVNDITICSIFVNPTQFNDTKDFDKYPITIEQDTLLLKATACEALFLPTVDEIYPNGLVLKQNYSLGKLESLLEGQFRPGHYQGVAMVVHKLLEIVMPDNLYLGQKDFQQCMVIKKLIELIGLNEKINLTICPTQRENDGLAMSSRNMRLSEEERKIAPQIFKTLQFINENQETLETQQLKKMAKERLVAAGFKVDYVEIADRYTLEPVMEWSKLVKPVALVAAYINDTRLIDNLLLE